MDTSQLSQLVKIIISGQRLIIGPMAVDLANKVSGVRVSTDLSSVEVSGNSTQVLASLVSTYQKLFGRASLEVCRDAVKEIKPQVPQDQLPEILR